MSRLGEDLRRFWTLSGHDKDISFLNLLLLAFSPRMVPITLLRASQYCHERRFLGLFSRFFSMMNVVIFGLEVSPKVNIHGGLFLPHTVGTVLGARSIGKNVTIMQGVTLGAAYPDIGFDPMTRPVIEDEVMIGAGAKVIGGIVVGRGAKIGANAVVTRNVPKNATVVGIPARVVDPGERFDQVSK